MLDVVSRLIQEDAAAFEAWLETDTGKRAVQELAENFSYERNPDPGYDDVTEADYKKARMQAFTTQVWRRP